MKRVVSLAIAAIAGQLVAGTYTWTGASGDNDYSKPGNWDPASVPGESDDVVIDGAAVTWSGTHRIPNTLTLLNGASLEIGNEIQFGNTGVNPIIYGGTVRGGLVAAQSSGASLTLSDAALISSTTGNNGFWQNGASYLNFTDGESRSASYTYQTSLAAGTDPFWFFSHAKGGGTTTTSPCIRYNGQIIDRDAYDDNFQSRDNGDGTCTLYFKPYSANVIRLPAASAIGETYGTISATVTRAEEGAIIYALWGTTAGDPADVSTWAGSDSLGEAQSETAFSKVLSGLEPETDVYFAFALLVGGEVVASTAVASFQPSAYTAKFLGTVSTAANVAANWRDGVVPTSSDTILIAADCDWGTMGGSANLSLQNWNVTVDGAALRLNGEVNRTGAATIRNGSLSASVFVGSGTPIEVRGSDMISTTTRGDITRGFYSNAPFFNFHSGDACSYTYHYNGENAPAEADEFAALFTQGRILVDGTVLTDSSRVSFLIDTENSTVKVTLLESEVEASFAAASAAAVNGLSATLSVTVEVGGGRALYVLTGSSPDSMTAEQVAAEATDNTTYTYVATGAEGTAVYWQFRLGEADDGLLDTTSPQSFFAMESGNLWTGATSGSASIPGNWSKGHVPTAQEPVYVVAEFAKNDLQWDISNATVASWRQIGNAVVYINGATNDMLTITGNAELGGGYWTHGGPSDDPSTILNVMIGGDLTIAAGAAIQAGTGVPNDAAQRARGFTRAHGPGYLREAGGSHAGEGAHIPAADFTQVSTYGSILEPMSYGSGGWGDNENYAGGGVIKLAVAGTLTVNGTICSRGFGYAQAAEANIGGAGSGGTVNITAAALVGSGRIDANGGNNGLYGPGSGGRVKVALTGSSAAFSGFSGTIEALGGSLQNVTQADNYDLSPGAGGTVCLVEPGLDPAVKVYNVWRYGENPTTWRVATDENALPSATHLPARQMGDSTSALKRSNWELSGNGSIRLTKDVQIASLSLASSDGTQIVYTDGFKLTTPMLVVNGSRFRSGTYTAETNPEFIKGDGSIVVGGSGFILMIR